MRKIKSYFPLIILALFAVMASLAVYKSSMKQNLGKEKNTSFLDSSVKIQDLFDENKFLTLADFVNEDNKYTIVNVFASWCSTCLSEHDILFDISKDDSFNLYGIAWNDYSKNTVKFLEKFGNPYAKVALDSRGILNKILAIKAVPETFLINPDGVIIYRHQGALTEKILKKLLNARK